MSASRARVRWTISLGSGFFRYLYAAMQALFLVAIVLGVGYYLYQTYGQGG